MTLSSSSAFFDTGKRHFLALCSPRGIKNRNYLGVVQCVVLIYIYISKFTQLRRIRIWLNLSWYGGKSFLFPTRCTISCLWIIGEQHNCQKEEKWNTSRCKTFTLNYNTFLLYTTTTYVDIYSGVYLIWNLTIKMINYMLFKINF